MILNIEIYAQEENSSPDVEFLKITIEPANILVGDSIEVFATVINNSDTPITFQGGCDSPIWLEFLSDNVEQVFIPGCQAPGIFQLESGQQQKVMGPGSGILYKAVSAGTLEAKVTFAYGIGKNVGSTNTISETIILEINSEKESLIPEILLKTNGEKREIPPRKQVSSGTNPQDVICSEGLKLIFKLSNNSPACVNPDTKLKLIQRGWAIS
jgi:hypothetical protein